MATTKKKTLRNANFQPFESRTINSRYLRITINMLVSTAWQKLDPYDITAYIYFKSKYVMRRDGTNNAKDISLTYDEMKGVMSPDRFKKCIDNLCSVGLIDFLKHKPHTRDATIYGLSDRWCKYGTEDFIEKKRVTFKRTKQGS